MIRFTIVNYLSGNHCKATIKIIMEARSDLRNDQWTNAINDCSRLSISNFKYPYYKFSHAKKYPAVACFCLYW